MERGQLLNRSREERLANDAKLADALLLERVEEHSVDFRIADTFTDSLARLTGDEQTAVKATAFDLQLHPSEPGLSFHKLDKARDRLFRSVRVDGDIWLIVHGTSKSSLVRASTGQRSRAIPLTAPSPIGTPRPRSSGELGCFAAAGALAQASNMPPRLRATH